MTLAVQNWARFQHYRNRRPPWIKLHRTLLDDYEFISLPLASQALAPRIWLLASESDDGSIPDDPVKLAFRLHCTPAEVVAGVNPLIRAKFLCGELSASSALARRKQNLTTETERETEGEEQRIAAPSAPPTSAAVVPIARGTAAPSWSREACDEWITAYRGTAPGGRIGKALAPLVKQHGWETVRTAWRSYLAQTEAEYASPQRFAATFGRWSGSAPQLARKPAAVIDNNRAVLARFVAGGEE